MQSSKKIASWLVPVVVAALLGLVLAGCDSSSPNAGQSRTTDRGKSREAAPPRTTKPLPARATASAQLIPYTVIERAETRSIKVSYELRVDLVDGRLPTEEELAAISRHLHAKERTHERTFVLFYLPGMPPGAGAFASAHHNPSLKVEVLPYMLPEQYRHLLATTTSARDSNPGAILPPIDARSGQESRREPVDTWEAGELIRVVQAGRDFTGRTLKLIGIALADQDQGLVNLGSREIYRSGYYFNFVSVFRVRRPIREGQPLSVTVKVTLCERVELANGKVAVIINATLAE